MLVELTQEVVDHYLQVPAYNLSPFGREVQSAIQTAVLKEGCGCARSADSE